MNGEEERGKSKIENSGAEVDRGSDPDRLRKNQKFVDKADIRRNQGAGTGIGLVDINSVNCRSFLSLSHGYLLGFVIEIISAFFSGLAKEEMYF